MRFAIAELQEDALNTKSAFEIKNLVDVFSKFGYGSDDIIDKRDQIVMFTRIRHELTSILHQMTSKSEYAHAIVLRDRLRLIKKEFIQLQQIYEKVIHIDLYPIQNDVSSQHTIIIIHLNICSDGKVKKGFYSLKQLGECEPNMNRNGPRIRSRYRYNF